MTLLFRLFSFPFLAETCNNHTLTHTCTHFTRTHTQSHTHAHTRSLCSLGKFSCRILTGMFGHCICTFMDNFSFDQRDILELNRFCWTMGKTRHQETVKEVSSAWEEAVFPSHIGLHSNIVWNCTKNIYTKKIIYRSEGRRERACTASRQHLPILSKELNLGARVPVEG